MNKKRKSLIILFVLVLPAMTVVGKENYSNWTREGIFDYSAKYLEKMKDRFERRSGLIEAGGGPSLVFDQTNLEEILGKPGSRKWEDFEKRELSQRNGEKALLAFAKDLELFRRLLIVEEKKMVAKWKPKEGEAAKLEPKMVEVFGEKIVSSRIGVILDNSPSMKPYLNQVRKQIETRFSYEYVVEIDGCFLWRWSNNDLGRDFREVSARGYFYEEPALGVNPFTPDRFVVKVPSENWHSHYRSGEQDTMAAMWTMVKLMKMDTIYWFCDLDDEIYEQATRELGKLVEESGTKLYLHTFDKKPNQGLARVVEASGGKVISERLR